MLPSDELSEECKSRGIARSTLLHSLEREGMFVRYKLLAVIIYSYF